MGAYDSTPKERSLPSVLIVGYKRTENIRRIIDLCKSFGVQRIFLQLDGIKSDDIQAAESRQGLLEFLEKVRTPELSVEVKTNVTNQGCAVTVLAGVDWALQSSNSIVVLEDDCIPTQSFFVFCLDFEESLNQSENIWLICGTQFAPRELTLGHTLRSHYALTWGWFTTKDKWMQIQKSIHRNRRFVLRDALVSLDPESCFWSAGARRAYLGFTDVWDTILIYCMKKESRLALLPGTSYVENLGDDEFAVHTSKDSRWTRQQTHKYSFEETHVYNDLANKWIKEHFYRIRPRHLLTTKLNFLADCFRTKKFSQELLERLPDSWGV